MNNGTDTRIENCDIRFNHGVGVKIFDRSILKNSHIHHNGQMGVSTIGAGILVEGNEIDNNNVAGYSVGWEAGGTKFVRTTNLIVRGNFSHHNSGPGLWTDIDNVSVLIENNVVEDNTCEGIFYEISWAGVIRNNKVRRNGYMDPRWGYGAGIFVSSSADVEVYGNLVENNARSITAVMQSRGTGTQGVHEVKNLKVHDNIIVTDDNFFCEQQNRVYPKSEMWVGLFQDVGNTAYFTSKGNSFYNNTYTSSSSNIWGWQNKMNSWTAWKAYGQDSTGSIVANAGDDLVGSGTDTTATGGGTDTTATGGGTDTTATGGGTDTTATVGVTDTTATGGGTDTTATVGVTDTTATGGGTDTTATVGVTDTTATGGGTDTTATGGGTDTTATVVVTDTTATGGGTDTTASVGGTDTTATGGSTDTTASVGGTDTTATGGGTDTTATVGVTDTTATGGGTGGTPPGSVPAGMVAIAPGTNIQSVINANPAGTSYFLRAGYHRANFTSANQIHIAPKNGDTFEGETGAVLSGAMLLTQFTHSGSSWYAAGLSVHQGTSYGTGPETATRPEDLFINDKILQRVMTLSEVGPGKWFFDYGADRVYFGDDPTGKSVEISSLRNAFNSGADNVTIKNLTIEKYACPAQSGAIQMNDGTDTRIENCDIRFNHGVGVKIFDRSILKNSHIHHNGQMGVSTIGAGILVEGNEIDHNNVAGYSVGWEAGGTKFVRTTNLIVRGNFSHHNSGPGLWTDIDNVSVLIENNVVEDNTCEGIFYEISWAGVIRNNKVRRNGYMDPRWGYGAGIFVSSSADVEVYGNLVENNARSITAVMQSRGTGTQGVHEVKNLKVHDNIIVTDDNFFCEQQNRVYPKSEMWVGLFQDVGNTAYFTSKGNSFYNNTYTSSSSNIWGWQNKMNSWTAWKAYGQDSTGSIVANAGDTGGTAGTGGATDTTATVAALTQPPQRRH